MEINKRRDNDDGLSRLRPTKDQTATETIVAAIPAASALATLVTVMSMTVWYREPIVTSSDEF